MRRVRFPGASFEQGIQAVNSAAAALETACWALASRRLPAARSMDGPLPTAPKFSLVPTRSAPSAALLPKAVSWQQFIQW